MTNLEEKTKFLEEYNILCEKYQLAINSCGCCGSPWVDPLKKANDIHFISHIDHLLEEINKGEYR